MFRYTLLLGTAAFACIAPSLAEETPASQDQVVLIAANKLPVVQVIGLRPVPETLITSTVSVLSSEDLAIRQSINVADELRAIPGVSVSRSGSLGGLTQVRIRGAEANHTLTLLNGIEVSDPVTGETDFGLFSALPVDRIEIARGEHSALYGSDAIGGVVNLQTQSDANPEGQLEYGSFNTLNGSATLGHEYETTGSAVSATLSGYQTDGVDTSGRGGEKDGSDSISALVNGSTRLGDTSSLSGLALYRQSNSQTDPDLDYDGLLDNADRETESTQWLIGGVLDAASFGLDHQIKASFNTVERENFADRTSSDKTTGERTKISYSPAINFQASEADIFLAGLVDWEQEDYKRVGVASFYGDPNQSQQFETFGIAAEARIEISDLDLTGSVRQDDNDGRFDDATTWRIGAAYDLPHAFRVRASLGEGVKNPTFTELFGYYPGSFIGNPDLKPESSESWEIGLDHAFGPVTASITYFEAELQDEIYTAYTPTFASTAANRIGDSKRSGVEISASWEVSKQVSLGASLSDIASENDSGVDEIRVPERTGSLSVNWTSSAHEGLRAGFALDYVGDQLDTDFGTYQTVTLDEYVLASGTIEYPVNDRIALTLRGENLFDTDISDVFGYHAPGAAAFVGFRLR